MKSRRDKLLTTGLVLCAVVTTGLSRCTISSTPGQESFGLKPWSEYATAAGVADLAAFDTCIKRTGALAGINR